MRIIKRFKVKKSDIGFWAFIGAQISFLLIFFFKGFSAALLTLITIICAILFVCYIDKDVLPTKKYNKQSIVK